MWGTSVAAIVTARFPPQRGWHSAPAPIGRARTLSGRRRARSESSASPPQAVQGIDRSRPLPPNAM